MSTSGRVTQNYLTQELGAFKHIHCMLEDAKTDLYRVLDCGNGYWFFGYLDLTHVGQGEVMIKTSFTDSLYKAVTSLDPSTFIHADSLSKFFSYRDQYTSYAEAYLLTEDKQSLPSFIHEPQSEAIFNNYIKDQSVKIDDDEFQLSM